MERKRTILEKPYGLRKQAEVGVAEFGFLICVNQRTHRFLEDFPPDFQRVKTFCDFLFDFQNIKPHLQSDLL